MNLTDKKVMYFIITSDSAKNTDSVLMAKEYKIIELVDLFNGIDKKSILGWQDIGNDEMRKDVIFILDMFEIEYAIVKYSGETKARKVFRDGSEKLLDINPNTILSNKNWPEMSYFYKGFYFNFIDEKRYWKPKQKSDFKKGMIVEYLNNEKWHQREVKNIDQEWDNMYKLLVKYDKIRSPSIN